VLTRLGVDTDGQTRWSFEPQVPFGQEPDLGIDIGKDVGKDGRDGRPSIE
jgi:hypothetical protein